jgi:diguanylate cyclase (GGDEF)-like protein
MPGKKKKAEKKKKKKIEKITAQRKTFWGYPIFLLSVLLAVFAVHASSIYSFSRFPFFYQKVLPYLGASLSVIALFIGHLSYPRVHNLRVYMAGYLTGMICFCYFLFACGEIVNLPGAPPPGYFSVICLLGLINFLFIPLLPSTAKYRLARSYTLAVLGVESVLLLTMRFAPGAQGWISTLEFKGIEDLGFWVGPLFFFVLTAFSLWRLRYDFSLGGLVSGCGLIFALIWTFGIDADRMESTQRILFSIAPFFLVIATLTHWFFRIENRVSFDPLLQIYNRDYCSKIITEQANMNVTPPFAVAMVDIDHFKNVNDTYGHQAGDAVLHSVAQTLLRTLSPQGTVCRYGGEELAVFFPQKTTSEVVPLMERAREEIEKSKTESGKKRISVTISCGISYREIAAQTVMEVIHAADKALYKAKKGGRNQVRCAKACRK